jgi:uncharacterized membrane protein (DUF4010 family)
MTENEPFISLGIALSAGLLIGLEREQSAPLEEKEGNFLGGARTYPIVALMGACAMLLARQVGLSVVVFGFAATLAFLVVGYAHDVKTGGDRGLTSEAALLLCYLLGALALTDGVFVPPKQKVFVVLAVAVVTTLLLSIKPSLHSFIRKASKADVYATLKFLVVAVVVLPLLPDRAMGPLDAINPYNLGLMVVLIAGISFVGYVGIRILGPERGIGLTGLVGGIVSSTAVTLSVSGRARQEPRLAKLFALAVVLASSIMFPRVLFEVAVVNESLVGALAIPMVAMGLAGAAGSAILFYRSTREKVPAGLQFSNPFELSSALKFALLFGGILLATKAATTYLGTGWTYLTSLVAGAADADAIALSMANLSKNGIISREVAVTATLIGAASNTAVKAALAVTVGGWAYARRIVIAFAGILAAGAAGLAFVWLGAGG